MKTNKLIAVLLSTLPMLAVAGCTDPAPSTDEYGRTIINIFIPTKHIKNCSFP